MLPLLLKIFNEVDVDGVQSRRYLADLAGDTPRGFFRIRDGLFNVHLQILKIIYVNLILSFNSINNGWSNGSMPDYELI